MYLSLLPFFLTSFRLISAVPLNINLGAYSPALVVGDGEISFGGAEAGGAAQSAAQIMSTLETSAVNAASSGQAGGQAGGEAGGQAGGAAGGAAGGEAGGAAGGAAAGQAGGDAQAPATTPTDPQQSSSASTDPATATSAAPTTRDESTTITKKVLQSGPILKREAASPDIQGFRESLNFATNAQKNTPELQIGTEAAGVGILQRPGASVPAGSPAAGSSGNAGAAAAKKRSIEEKKPQRRGITLLAIAEI